MALPTAGVAALCAAALWLLGTMGRPTTQRTDPPTPVLNSEMAIFGPGGHVHVRSRTEKRPSSSPLLLFNRPLFARMGLEAWHTEDNANVELVPWRSEKVVTSLVERYRPPRCRKVQEKKRNSCESRYLAFGQGWLKGAQDWLKWWDKDGKFVRKDFRRWLAAEKGGRRLKMKSRRDIAAANKAGWAGLYCRCAENSECGCGACE